MDKKPEETKQTQQGLTIIFEISGRVINHETRLGAADLRIEAWHKGGPLRTDNKLIGPPTPLKTTAQGDFHITATVDHFKEFSIPKTPDVFFMVFGQDGKLLKSTEDGVLRKVESGRTNIVIEVDIATGANG